MVFGLPPRRTRSGRYSIALSTAVALVAAAAVLAIVVMWALAYNYPD